MCITSVCWQRCDVITFEINVIFLMKPFWYMSQKSREKLKYLENGNSFWGEIKSIFHAFKGLIVAKNSPRTWECAFKIRSMQEPCPLKQVFSLINFIKSITLMKSLMVLSRGGALKSPITIKLSYELEKTSIISVKDFKNRERESKGGLSSWQVSYQAPWYIS